MGEVISRLAAEVARAAERAAGLPVCVSDAHGRVLAGTPALGWFCPLFAREGEAGAPLPARCIGCARIAALEAGEHERVAPCPNGADAVRPVVVSGELEGWILTPVLPRDRGACAERAAEILGVAAAPLAAAIAADRRERLGRDLLSQKLLVARLRVGRALERLAPEAPARRDLECAGHALEQACDILEAFRAAPSPAAEVAAEAAEASAGSGRSP